MAVTKNATSVQALTRNDVMQGIAGRFLDIASDHGSDISFYSERLEIMCRMMLVHHFIFVVYDDEKPIGGVTMHFDWDRHVINVQNSGEFIEADQLNQYGTMDSATETLDAIRTYVSGLFEQCNGQSVLIWYALRPSRIAELGASRVDQMLGIVRTEESEAAKDDRRAQLYKAMTDKGTKRITLLGDFDEASFEAW